jgi:signal transduction histidine kinase
MSARDSMAPRSSTGENEPQAGLSPETAHDLRSLLQIIVGCAANIRDNVSGNVTATATATATTEQVSQATRIIEAAESAAALIQLDGGYAQSVSVEELVREVVSLFEDAAKSLPARLVVACEPDLGLTDQGARIRRVTLNLLSNALKFGPFNGEVHVKVERLQHDERWGSGIRITVADQGPGIPEEDRTRVLAMGARLERDRARPGSGIGLAVVKRGVELSGGSLTIGDTEGGGATFVVELPAFVARNRPLELD